MRNKKTSILYVILASIYFAIGCSDKTASGKLTYDNPSRLDFVRPIEKKHGYNTWIKQKVFQCEFESNVHNSNDRNTIGTMTFTPNMSHCRMDIYDSISVVFDGKTCWVSPSDAEYEMARFNLLTAVYWFMLPFKLSDPGTFIELKEERTIHGKSCDVGLMTFSPDQGDAPDDWYLIFKDQDNQQLLATAYISTEGEGWNKVSEAGASSCTYENVLPLDGWPDVKMARSYSLRKWSNSLGMAKISHGQLSISNPRFVDDLPANFFSKPDDAREDVIEMVDKEDLEAFVEDFDWDEFIEERKYLFGLGDDEEYTF